MRYLSYATIPIVLGLVLFLAKKENDIAVRHYDKDLFIMRLPKIYGWIGAISSIFFISLFVLMILYPNDTAEIWVGAVFAGFLLLSLSLVISYAKWRILVYRDYILYITMFGRFYKYDYSQIKSAKLSQSFFRIKTADREFFVDPHAIGLEVLLDRFREHSITIK